MSLLRGNDSAEQDGVFPEHKVAGGKRKREDNYYDDSRNDKRISNHSVPTVLDGDRHPVHKDKANTSKSGDPLDRISNMRFRDAGGRHSHMQQPWYSSLNPGSAPDTVGRDVWGNEDAGRQARNQKRVVDNDPLLAMKKGVKQLREVEKQKSEWRVERERDLNEVEELARRERHRRRKEDRQKHGRDRDKYGNGRRSRHRSRSRSPRRDRRSKS